MKRKHVCALLLCAFLGAVSLNTLAAEPTAPESAPVTQTTAAPVTTTAPVTTAAPVTTTAPVTTAAPVYSYQLDLVLENGTAFQSMSHSSTVAEHTFHWDAVPSKDGYTFSGWTDGTMHYTDHYTAAPGVHTLYAVWTATPYTVTYVDGSSIVGQETYSVKQAPSLLRPAKAGYDFLGWSLNGSILPFFPSGITGNITLEAQWTPVNYTVAFNTAGGDLLPAMTYTIESGLILPTPTRDAYRFGGWVTFPEGTPVGIIPVGTYGNLSLTAQWKAIDYTVTFNPTGGDPLPPATYTVETGLILPTPKREAYTFTGWVSVPDGRPVDLISIGTYGDAALAAQWKANTYTITYHSNGGSVCEPTLYTVESGAILPLPTRPGYRFAGWRDVRGNSVSMITPGIFGDLILTAEWVELTATIQYTAVSNGGRLSVTEETVGQATGRPASAAIPDAGYRFVGWYRDPACTIPVPANWVDAANVICPAQSGAAMLHSDAVYYAKFALLLGRLTIAADCGNGQSLLFTVTGNPTAADLPPVNLTAAIPAGQGSVTICDLPVGIYTITEQDDWSWRYAEMQAVTLMIEPGEQSTVPQTAAFIPKLIVDRWLGDIGYKRKEY